VFVSGKPFQLSGLLGPFNCIVKIVFDATSFCQTTISSSAKKPMRTDLNVIRVDLVPGQNVERAVVGAT
jgi:hypothetical protein